MSGSNKYHQRHALNSSYVSKAQPNQFCQKVTLSGGKLDRCMRETNGKTYCVECFDLLSRRPAGRRYYVTKIAI